jgi:RNA polymerase sigma-70 factor (ECF subfamily)
MATTSIAKPCRDNPIRDRLNDAFSELARGDDGKVDWKKCAEEQKSNFFDALLLFSEGVVQRQASEAFVTMQGDDIVNTVSLKVFNALSKFGEQSKLSTWVETIIRNELKSAHRARSSLDASEQLSSFDNLKKETDFSGSIADPRSLTKLKLPDLERTDLVGPLVAAIARLQPQHSAVIELVLKGHSLKEIAGELAVPEGTVKSRLFKARKILGQEILGSVSEPEREILHRYNR